MSDLGIIYKLSSPSGKEYIGQTTESRFDSRMNCHKNMNDDCTALNKAITKYGWNNFNIEVLGKTSYIHKLDDYEKKFIQLYKTYGKGYNLTMGGKGCRGYVKTKSECDKISVRMKKFWDEIPSSIKNIRMKKLREGHKKYVCGDNRPDLLSRLSEIRIKPKSIVGIHLKSGNTRTFESVNSASRILSKETGKQFQRGHISRCANKIKNCRSHHGWRFEFKD